MENEVTNDPNPRIDAAQYVETLRGICRDPDATFKADVVLQLCDELARGGRLLEQAQAERDAYRELAIIHTMHRWHGDKDAQRELAADDIDTGVLAMLDPCMLPTPAPAQPADAPEVEGMRYTVKAHDSGYFTLWHDDYPVCRMTNSDLTELQPIADALNEVEGLRSVVAGLRDNLIRAWAMPAQPAAPEEATHYADQLIAQLAAQPAGEVA